MLNGKCLSFGQANVRQASGLLCPHNNNNGSDEMGIENFEPIHGRHMVSAVANICV